MKVLCHYDLAEDIARQVVALSVPGVDLMVCPEADEVRFNALLPSVEAIWHVLKPITAEDIAKAPKLRLIQKLGVGINTIDTDAAGARGIAVCNTPGANTRSVAEMTLLLILSSLRRLPQMLERAKQPDKWSISPAMQANLGELGGRTVGFVGFGAVPSMLAPWVTAIGARVVYFNRTPKPEFPYTMLTLQRLLAESDIVSLHVPLTDDTASLLNADRLRLMKPGAILINTARGALIDEPALPAALQSGTLDAAGLDVFATEPVHKEHPFLVLPNVIATPHIAWLTREALLRCIGEALANIRRLMTGARLRNRVV
jgi:phosphoglycerate dehydrogenase-like enzyme